MPSSVDSVFTCFFFTEDDGMRGSNWDGVQGLALSFSLFFFFFFAIGEGKKN